MAGASRPTESTQPFWQAACRPRYRTITARRSTTRKSPATVRRKPRCPRRRPARRSGRVRSRARAAPRADRSRKRPPRACRLQYGCRSRAIPTAGAAAADNLGVQLFAARAGIGTAFPHQIVGHRNYPHSGVLVNRTVGTATDCSNIYVGDSQGIIFGDLLDFQIDLNPWSKFQSFQIDIRGVKRMAILVAVPSAWTKHTGVRPGLMGT